MSENSGNGEMSISVVRKDKPGVVSNVQVRETGDVLGKGLEATVHRVGLVSDIAPDRVVPLVSKEFNLGESIVVPYERIFENYRLVKDAGLPVPQTFRAREDEKGMFMTDLSEQGKNEVLSLNDVDLSKVQKMYGEKATLMNSFAHGVDLESDMITSQTDDLIRKATDANLLLHSDTWFVIVKPGGTYNFMIGDFANVRKKEEVEKTREEQISGEQLYEMNRDALDYVRQRVGKVQKYGLDPSVLD